MLVRNTAFPAKAGPTSHFCLRATKNLLQSGRRAKISVGAAEGCESVGAFAAFGSSYNIIRATPAIVAVDLLLICF